MGNLLKKVTSTVSVLAIAASAMGATASVSAASEFLAYADMLAKSGVINSTTEANYRLGDTITRAEVAKIAVKLSGVEMYDCVGDVFSDVGTSLGDLCSAIETAAAEGFVNANADKFRPTDKVTRAELVKMLLAANGVEPSDTAANFKDTATIGDLAGYINAGVEIGAIKDGEYFRPNANATRGEAFKIASVVMDSVEPTTPPTNGTGTTTPPTNGTGTTTPPTTSTGTTSTGVVTAGGLSIMTDSSAMQYVPSVGTVKAGKYTFAAASSDVTVKSLVMKRGGLGQRSDIDTMWFEYMGKRVTTEASINSDETVTLSFTPAWKLMMGTSATLDLIIKLKNGVSGAQHNFAIVAAKDVSSTASVLTASFPVVSNTLITTSYQATAIDFKSVDSTSARTVKAGEKDIVLGEFQLTASGSDNRDVVLKNVMFYNSGSLDAKYLANLAIYSKVTGAKVSSSVIMNGRNLTFMVNDAIPYTNSTRTYQVKADIIGVDRSEETLQFSFDGRNENITVEEVATGYRAATKLDTTKQNLYPIKVQGGSVSLVNVGNTSNADVSAGQSDVVLARGTITAREQVKLRDLTLMLTAMSSGTGANPATISNRIRVAVGGQSVTVDPSQFNNASKTYVIKNTFVVDAGVSDVIITADVRSDAPTNSSLELATLTMATVGNATTVGFADKRYTSTDQQVVDAYGSLSPIKVTVKGAGISVSNQSASSTNVVGGAKELSLLKYTLNNNDVSAVTVTSETFTVTITGASGSTDAEQLKNMQVDMYLNGTITDSRNVTSVVASGNNATGTVTFSKTLSVQKSSSATVELKTPVVPRFVTGTITVTRTSNNGASADSNVSDTNGNNVKVAGGAVTSYGLNIQNASADIAIASDDSAELVIASAGAVELGKIRVRATNDDLRVKELYLTINAGSSTGVATQVARLIQSPTLVDATGKVVAYGSVLREGSIAFIKFTNFVDSSFAIARNTDATLSVKAAVASLATGDSGTLITLTAGANVTQDSDVTSSNVADKAIRAEGSVATLTSADVLTSATATKADLVTSGKLVIAAAGVSDAAAGKIKFTVTNNGTDTVNLNTLTVASANASSVTLYKGDVANTSEIIGTGSVTSTGVAINVGTSTVPKVEIAAGQTVTILADFTGVGPSTGENTINVSLNDVAYFDKAQGIYETTAIGTIASYKGTGLPASTSFKMSGTGAF